MSERAIVGIKMVIMLSLSLTQSVDRAPSFAVLKYNIAVRKYNLAVGKYNLAVGKYNFAVREYNFAVHSGQVHGGVAAVEEPGRVPPARPQQLLNAVAEEPGTQQHFYKEHNNLESLAVIQFDFGFSNCTFSISFQFRA